MEDHNVITYWRILPEPGRSLSSPPPSGAELENAWDVDSSFIAARGNHLTAISFKLWLPWPACDLT